MTQLALNNLDLLDRFYDRNETRHSFMLSSEDNSWFLGTDVFLCFPLCFSHFWVRLMIKREQKVKKVKDLVKHLLLYYVIIVPMTFILLSLYLNILTRYQQPPWIISGHWFCQLFEGFCHASIVYLSLIHI